MAKASISHLRGERNHALCGSESQRVPIYKIIATLPFLCGGQSWAFNEAERKLVAICYWLFSGDNSAFFAQLRTLIFVTFWSYFNNPFMWPCSQAFYLLGEATALHTGSNLGVWLTQGHVLVPPFKAMWAWASHLTSVKHQFSYQRKGYHKNFDLYRCKMSNPMPAVQGIQ